MALAYSNNYSLVGLSKDHGLHTQLTTNISIQRSLSKLVGINQIKIFLNISKKIKNLKKFIESIDYT